MTENELVRFLHTEMQGLVKSVNGIGREVSGISGKLDGICADVERNRTAIGELQREDATGRIEIEGLKNRKVSTTPRMPTGWGGIALKYAPWLIPLLFAAGVWAGTGGDDEAAAKAWRDVSHSLSAVTQRLDSIEQTVGDTDCDMDTDSEGNQ